MGLFLIPILNSETATFTVRLHSICNRRPLNVVGMSNMQMLSILQNGQNGFGRDFTILFGSEVWSLCRCCMHLCLFLS